MKRISVIPFLILSSVFVLASCKSSTSPSGGGSTFNTVMTATVNGRAWGGIIPGFGTNNGYSDFFAGDSNSSIEMYYTQTDTGTFPVNGNTGDDLFMTYDSTYKNANGVQDNMYVSYAKSGSVHFTRLDSTHDVGTFNFKAINNVAPFDTVTITNGTFNITK